MKLICPGLFLALIALSPPLAAQTAVERSVPLDADARVEIDNLAGSVSVRGWDGGEVRISGTLGRSVEELRIEGDRRRLVIQVVYPRNGSLRRADASDLVVELPRQVELAVQTVSASIAVEGLDGARINLRSVSGRVDLRGDAAEVDIGSVSGDVLSRGGGARLRVETVSGAVEVDSEAADIGARSVSGRVAVRVARVERLNAATVSGSVEVTVGALSEGARVEAETMSGSVVLTLPPGQRSAVEASTFSGRIRSDFGEVVGERFGPGQSLKFEPADAVGRIKATAFSGSVTLKQG